MKSFTHKLWLEIPNRRGFQNITSEVEKCLLESGIQEGLCLVNTMHTTSSVFINDDEQGLLEDMEQWLENTAPEAPYSQYKHNNEIENNADAHLKRSVMGREVVIAVTEGRFDFGPWEKIIYAEFDGLRPKLVLVKIIGE
jgi:secondary thiamine-phosphate synthase enzyme